ncbi:MAG TPA: MFS transporter, partial [Thermococcaceae archaeon]|nr:MFS transporter [Thermococcaceae archaeon]
MKASRKRENASLRAIEDSALFAYTKKSKIRWFYAFVPFKVSTGGTSTLIPLLTLEAGGSAQEVGVINAIGSIASMIGGVFWGKLSDKMLKRKPFLILGFIGTSLFSFLMAFSRSITQLMVLNFLYSFFIAATIPIPVILIARVLKKKQLDYGIAKFNEIGGWAWVVGLILGFFLAYFLSIRQLLVVFAVVNIPSIVLGVKWIQEAPFRVERKSLGVYANYIVEKFRYLPNIMIHLPEYNKRALTRFLEFKEFYLASILFWVGAMLYFSQFPVLLKSR